MSVCPSLLLIVIVLTILLVLTCRKYRSIVIKHPKDEEERSSVTASSADIDAKTESDRNAPDKAPSDSESDDEETMRKEPVANKPDQRKEEAKGSNSAVVNNSRYSCKIYIVLEINIYRIENNAILTDFRVIL